MRVIAAALLLVALCGAAYGIQLPDGYNSASDVARVLANEPDAARFMSTSECAGPDGCGAKSTDSITFSDSGVKTVSSLSGVAGGSSEFDGQIEQVESDIKKLTDEKNEAEECAKRVKELAAELRGLKEQKNELEKQKQKAELQTKLEAQMKDLNEINGMSRALKSKYSELKRTQQVIRSRMAGTRSTLNQIDSEPSVSNEESNEGAENVGKQLDALNKVQKKILEAAHKSASSSVTKTLKDTRKVHEN